MRDPNTNSEVIKDIYCHRLQNGTVFSMSYYNSLGAAATGEFMAVIGTVTAASAKVIMAGAGKINLYEGITSSANGTTVTSFCFNRTMANSCSTAFFYTPTWSTNSEVLIFQDYIAGGSTPQTRVGGDAHQDSEVILKAGTKYLFQFVNLSGATNTVSLNMIMCEL